MTSLGSRGYRGIPYIFFRFPTVSYHAVATFSALAIHQFAALATVIGVIDPVLLPGGSDGHTTNGATTTLPSTSRPSAPADSPPTRPARRFTKTDVASWTASGFAPQRDANETRSQYEDRLTHVSRKVPLAEACTKLGISVPKSANLERLREELAKHWQKEAQPIASTAVTSSGRFPAASRAPFPASSNTPFTAPTNTSSAAATSRAAAAALNTHSTAASDTVLLRRYDVDRANVYELLGYEDDGVDEDEGEDEQVNKGPEDMEEFRRGVRVAAVQRTEGNRHPGGLKTQQAMVKAWNEFTLKTIQAKKIPDAIVDEHSLLMYINFCAERPKRTRKGVDIPGTFIGASHLKKLFFGALRIRKEQDAGDPSLAHRRPASSVIAYDSIKTRMDEALVHERNGLTPEEDAPDIRANTWLSQVKDEDLTKIGFAFLSHRQLRLAIWGHLAWTAQHASGNRGDDFRALKLAELQPTTLLHPNKRTEIYSVINPVYSVFIANLKPEMCPLGAFAFYFHYIYDEKKIIETMKLDYKVNKSWRMIHVLHGQTSPTTPFNEQNMYSLYSNAYKRAGFSSRLKAHLPRHLLGYKQESMGVDPLETSKLGWVRGQTYMDTYAPALPKKAILGAAGYHSDEPYDPIWRKIRVPEQFLLLVCPMAEEMREKVAGAEHLSGAFNQWEMAIELREHFFQCGGAIWQLCPESSIFRLPAFQNTDIRNWMTTGYPSALSVLQAAAGSPIDLRRIENEALHDTLASMRDILEVKEILNRRTAVLTPARGFSASTYHRNGTSISQLSISSLLILIFFQRSRRQLSTMMSPMTDVFPAIQQPDMCWEVWGPKKTLDQFESIQAIWNIYSIGERVSRDDGPIQMKPPLKLVELFFQHHWRTSTSKQERQRFGKVWERFRKIPEWIDHQSTIRRVPSEVVMSELEALRMVEGGTVPRGINWLRTELATQHKAVCSVIFLHYQPSL
ncbi:hypothetical protein B0H17DRAFT_1164275 [Mycena rosella]|uniref:Ndc10 domain-containing protein n=1 Tax=Mycena rosella TaxID=1033263 RepID=A0AAD7BSL0_MYCRO|nr:hypothetical protein B0H17DRAFT_1164275 [Mycena rosella]